jgi:KaiC/GvpD/RAD55 family RecA-like ATPase
VTPSPSEETAAGLERFEHANIQPKIILQPSEIKLGEHFKLTIQITNIGKQTILVDKVEEIIPPGFQLIDKPSYCHLEDMHLSIKGKRIDPLRTEEFKLTLRAFGAGNFNISPKIVYVDNTGHQQVAKPESATIKVSTVHLPDRITTGYGPLDDLLLGGIPKNYAVVLTSPSCDERDSLIRKFLEAGIKQGQITFYATTKTIKTEKFPEELQSNFYMFICNPQADMIARSAPNLQAHMFKFKGVENLTEINIAITSAMRKLNTTIEAPKRCCIQIISDVLLQHKALQTRRWLTGLLTELKSRGFITLAIMDMDMHSLQEARAVLDLFEGEISIYEKTDKKTTEKSLAVKRMARQKFSKREISL